MQKMYFPHLASKQSLILYFIFVKNVYIKYKKYNTKHQKQRLKVVINEDNHQKNLGSPPLGRCACVWWKGFPNCNLKYFRIIPSSEEIIDDPLAKLKINMKKTIDEIIRIITVVIMICVEAN